MTAVRRVALGACLVLAGATALTGCGGKAKPSSATTTTVAHQQLPANAVRIHWKPKALVPATRAGHICITTYKTGHFCSTYVSGEIPATALKRALRARGWVVVRS